MAKLTLSVDADVVSVAKRYATRRGTSVSHLVEEYLRLVSKLSDALLKAVADEGTRKRLLDLGGDLSNKAATTPAGLQKHVETEVARWNRVLKDAGGTK